MGSPGEHEGAEAIASLPYVDEHAVEVGAGAGETWRALLAVERSFGSGATPHLARLLGCEDESGFHVARSEPGRELALAGGHRFSRYALIFRLDSIAPGRSRLRAETRAEFPGLSGAAYRALVIGSRGHVLATRRMLAAVRRRAERAPGGTGVGAGMDRPPAGLCDRCRHQRLVPNTRGSVFSLCERSRSDDRFPRYPRLPVLECIGFEPRPDAGRPA